MCSFISFKLNYITYKKNLIYVYTDIQILKIEARKIYSIKDGLYYCKILFLFEYVIVK